MAGVSLLYVSCVKNYEWCHWERGRSVSGDRGGVRAAMS